MNGKKKLTLIFGFFLIFLIISFVGSDNPPMDNWILWKRIATTEVYKNTQTGEYRRTIGQGTQFIDDKTRRFPNYVTFNETFFSLINSSNPLYDYELDQYYEPGWSVYFKSNPAEGQVVKYIVNNTEITFQPMALNYRNDLDQIQQIQMVQEVVGVNSTNKFTYPNAYGTGIDLNYENKLGIMKENLVIDYFSRLPTPPQYIIDGGNPTLDLDFIIETNSKMIINGVEWDKKNIANTQGQVLIQNTSGTTLYKLPSPVIRDSNDSEVLGKYQFKKQGNSLYVVIKTPYSWLEDAVYPVYIDPTVTLQDADTENMKDTEVYEDIPNTNYGSDTNMNSGVGATSKRWRIYITFNISQIIDDSNFYNISSANISLYNYNGGGSPNISVYHVYDDWRNSSGQGNILTESQLTWNNQPCDVNFTNSTFCNLTQESFNYSNGSTVQWIDWDVTNTLKNETGNNDRNVTFVFGNISSGDSNYIKVWTKEYTSDTSLRPKLTITYTPYIDIITPTPSQTFTDDEPTANFNVSTPVDMDACFWSPDSGVTNYSMTNLTNWTTWTLQNTTMIDGSYTNTVFYCNESSDGTWRTSDTVSFDVDSVNITVCRDLTVSNRNYTIQNNIDETGSTCIDFDNTNITLDGNNYNITLTGSGETILMDSNYGRLHNFTNITCIGNGCNCISIDGGSFNRIDNITLVFADFTAGLVPDAISISTGDSNNISIDTMITDGDGLQLGSATNPDNNRATIKNLTCKRSTTAGIDAYDGIGLEVYDTIIYDCDEDVEISGGAELILLNVTYGVGVEDVQDTSILTRKWYFETEINDSDGYLQDANINITNITDDNVFSGTTDTNGNITRQEIIEYINNGGTKTYATPHTVNVSKTDYIINTTTYNLTTEQNIFHYVTLSPSITISITHPEPQTYAINESLPLNYTITNLTILDTCWYYVYNSSNDLEISNTTITCNQNTTFNVSIEDTYTLYLWVNETGGEEDSDSVTFEVSLTGPAVVLDYPTNNLVFNHTPNNIYFNFTATDSDGLGTCELWHNATGTWHKNYTWINPTNATQNYTVLNLTDINAIWNVWCNDTLGNSKFALNNFTVIVDTINPSISINTPITTTQGSQTITFNTTVTDANLDSCWYSIYNSSRGIDGLNNNVSFTCNSPKSATVSAFATYNLTVYANDSAGNENSSTESFTTTPASGGSSGGGGTTTISQALLTTNFSLITPNFQTTMDISLAKDSVRPRTKEFQIINRLKEAIEVEILCEPSNMTKANQSIDVCSYVEISNTTLTLSPNEEERTIGYIKVITPDNAEFGEEYFFNLIAYHEESNRYSKLSVRTKVSWLATLFYKWSYLPQFKQQAIQDEIQEKERFSYPVSPVAFVLSTIAFLMVFFIFKFGDMTFTGFFVGILSFVILYPILAFFL